MNDQRCESCDLPATHFFNSVTSNRDGTSTPSATRRFCSIHAREHEDAMNREQLERLPHWLRSLQRTSRRPAHTLTVRFSAGDEAAVTAMRIDLERSCGGSAAIVKDREEWEAVWSLPLQPDPTDQWEYENWSRRLIELAKLNHCRYTAFGFEGCEFR